MAAKVVNFLDDGVDGHFVLVVALRRVPRGRKGVAFVDDEEGLPGLSGLLGDDIKRLVEKRAHLADLARSADAGAEFKQHRLLAGFASQSVARAFGRDSLSCADIAREDNQGIPVRDRAADGEFLVMKFPAPCAQLLPDRPAGEDPGAASGNDVSKPTSLFAEAAMLSFGSSSSSSKSSATSITSLIVCLLPVCSYVINTLGDSPAVADVIAIGGPGQAQETTGRCST